MGLSLGTVLFQLHPGIVYSEATLERILDNLDPSFANVLEFRHESWWQNNVLKALRQHNITFCSISYPSLPDEVYKTSPVVHYRFHGVPEVYRSSYSTTDLKQIHQSIRKFRGVEEVYAYFNNDIEVAAVYNAKALQ